MKYFIILSALLNFGSPSFAADKKLSVAIGEVNRNQFCENFKRYARAYRNLTISGGVGPASEQAKMDQKIVQAKKEFCLFKHIAYTSTCGYYDRSEMSMLKKSLDDCFTNSH